jgi:hypothetical protein
MNDKMWGHGKRKNTDVNTQETDDGRGSGSNGADGQTVDGLIAISGDFEVRAVDEDEGRVVGDVKIDDCRSWSLSGDACA